MKKISLYLTLAFAGLFLGSCGDEYEPWANPQSNAQEDAITIPGFTASAVSAIDLNAVKTDSVKTFSLSTAALPSGYTLSSARIVLTPDGVDNATSTEFTALPNGETLVSSLQSLITSTYGFRPTPRTFSAHVYATALSSKGGAYIDCGTIKVTVTPVAPFIDTAYYITGGINSWTNTDKTYKLVNGGGDVYSDPVFTIVLSAAQVDKGFEFKLTPEVGLGGDWSKCVTAATDNAEGKLALNNAGGNLKLTPVDGAKFYRLSFNLLDLTWSVTPLFFSEFYYEIGNESGWATSHALYSVKNDGTYRGFYYLDGEFKFKPNADNWNDDLEYVSEGKLISTGGPNVPDPGAGFYMIDLDAVNLTYALTKVEKIGIIGGFNGWGGDVDMTYNTTGGYWEANATFSATSEYKFRMNGAWAVNWGGDVNNLAQDGANLSLDAGTYNFKLYLSYQGKNKVVITKQ
jgi:hypothetical protein